ncbi:28794_t:CDS:2 [Gigaspora margarita]|uniref:28794_t:CDS:1 n=1 Tax=Gigaspora margarita TaxID=4874 RepID=A0ABM8W559_GIGMA|nr:28794_t:CDS:2 [Gigaspora margarita]
MSDRIGKNPFTRQSWQERVLQIIQIKNIELEIQFEDKVMITSQLEEGPAQNPDAICLRCEKKAENDRYWIICEANMITLDEIIRQAVDRCLLVIERKKTRQIGDKQVQEYIEKYKTIYMLSKSKLKIGIITKKLHNSLGVINNQRHNIELHHNIISKLYTQIWILSHQKGKQYYRSWVIDFIKNNTKAIQLDSVVQ